MIGVPFALHAGVAKLTMADWRYLETTCDRVGVKMSAVMATNACMPKGAIVGVATIHRWFELWRNEWEDSDGAMCDLPVYRTERNGIARFPEIMPSPWWDRDYFGWEWTVTPINPITNVRGQLGFWTLPNDVAEMVNERMEGMR
jgi:hypothetical protein